MENQSELILRLKNMYEDNIQAINSYKSLKNNLDSGIFRSFALSTARLKEIIIEIEKNK